MKTPDAECNPSVTLTVTVAEAMTILSALRWSEQTHRKGPSKPGDGKWGHFDCPPQTQELEKTIKAAIKAEHPETFTNLFV
jgi:hypothetical protein